MTDELDVMAREELDAACALPFADIRKVTPWGDSFTGFAPSGREVEVRDPVARAGAEAKTLLLAPD